MKKVNEKNKKKEGVLNSDDISVFWFSNSDKL